MRKTTLVAVLLGTLTLGAARHRAVKFPSTRPIPVETSRSLVITDPAVLLPFDFQRVLQALIDRSAATSTTPLSLYRQWFDTQNPKPGLAAVSGAPHCDDFLTDGKPSFNGFARLCPTPEGVLATTDPFTAHDYTPIGIANRFDLTPVDGSNCGQYRIIYAKTTSTDAKLHIIFEPTLRNPNPSAGVEGCRGVAQFWADLSTIDSADERRARIEKFFFDGIDGFDPVLLPGRFAHGVGGIRTAQSQSQTSSRRFYQFHLQQDGSRLLVVPGVLSNLPYGPLFNAATPLPLGPDFRQFFISQIQTLAVRDVNGFFDDIPDKYLLTESTQDKSEITFASSASYFPGLTTPEGQAFKTAMTAELQRIGSTISILDLLNRVDLQNCHGCHFSGAPVPVGEGVMFPLAAANGTHVDETMDGGNFTISAALRDIYAPNRARILIDFLNRKPLPAHSNGSIGGGGTSD